jgi:hypothetical protein
VPALKQPKLTLKPIAIRAAQVFVNEHHRHHKAPVGAKFCIALLEKEEVVGVVIVGRPVARRFDDGYTAEVTRCCVLEGYPNGCSMLYGAAWRTAKAMGYRRIVTYTLSDESGTSLQAAGWRCLRKTRGGSWDREVRPREDKSSVEPKVLWENAINQ